MWLLAATQILPCLSEASSIDILTAPYNNIPLRFTGQLCDHFPIRPSCMYHTISSREGIPWVKEILGGERWWDIVRTDEIENNLEAGKVVDDADKFFFHRHGNIIRLQGTHCHLWQSGLGIRLSRNGVHSGDSDISSTRGRRCDIRGTCGCHDRRSTRTRAGTSLEFDQSTSTVDSTRAYHDCRWRRKWEIITATAATGPSVPYFTWNGKRGSCRRNCPRFAWAALHIPGHDELLQSLSCRSSSRTWWNQLTISTLCVDSTNVNSNHKK